MSARLGIPNEACKFILFQRTNYILFARAVIYRTLNRLIPAVTFERMVGAEARIRASWIKAQYLEDMRQEYQSISEYLPERCGSA